MTSLLKAEASLQDSQAAEALSLPEMIEAMT
jgi:hypothetical protein